MRRAFVLVAVLLVTVALAAGLLAMLTGVRGQSEAVFAVADRQAQRHAARSAAYAIAAEIGEARERLLTGALPELDDRRSVLRFEDAPGWEMSIESGEGESAIRPLSGAVDVHEAPVETIDMVAPGAGERIVSGRPYRTSGQLRAVLGHQGDHESADAIDADLFTLVSIDPPLRSGAGGPAGSAGEPRASAATGASPPIGLSAEGAAFAAAISDGSWRPSSLGHILRETETRGVPQEDWDLLLDWAQVGEARARRGLIDLNHAPAKVLAALPGMDEAAAQSLVDRRSTLSEADRSGLSWPVREGLVSLSQYADIVDRFTVRSMQVGLRFRVERERPELGSGLGTAQEEPGSAMVFEAIVDASGERARLVYLRDVTFEAYEAGVRAVVESDEPAEPLPESEASVDDANVAAGEPEADTEEAAVSAPPGDRIWGRFAVEAAR